MRPSGLNWKKTKRGLRWFLAISWLALFPAISLALPDYEPFNYSAGANLIGQTTSDGLTWVGAGAGATQITATSGNLSVFGLAPSTGNSIQIPSTSSLSARMPIGFTVTSGTLYYSFLMKVADLTGLSTTGSHLAGFNNSVGSQTQIPTAIGTRLLLRATGTGGFNIGLSKASTTTTDWTWSPAQFQTNETVFLVGSYTINSATTSDDVAKLWINPDPILAPRIRFRLHSPQRAAPISRTIRLQVLFFSSAPVACNRH